MRICTFFGHKDTPETIKPALRAMLIDLIENHGVQSFYVGNNGQFDGMVVNLLKELKETHAHIDYTIVLAYMPDGKINSPQLVEHPTIFSRRTICCSKKICY